MTQTSLHRRIRRSVGAVLLVAYLLAATPPAIHALQENGPAAAALSYGISAAAIVVDLLASLA